MLLNVKISKSTYDNQDAKQLFKEINAYLKKRDQTDNRDLLTDYLETHNLRKTVERYKILEVVNQESETFCINSVHQKVDRDLIVSSMTVRNTFNLLLEIGIIKYLDENQKNELFNTTYFELV